MHRLLEKLLNKAAGAAINNIMAKEVYEGIPPPELNHSIVVWDDNQSRRAWVSEIISAAGGIPRLIERGSQMSCANPIAIVAVSPEFDLENPARLIIATCKNTGGTVIAFADGVKQWPIRLKCLPLLAGATHLLDSRAVEFATELRQLLEQNLQSVSEGHRELQKIRDIMHSHGMVGESSAITEVFRMALRFSQLSDLPVLITGESGTGKELVARAIGAMDPKRKNRPFVTVNCAAVNSSLMESEFFGHRRGAFTGAERDRKGLIRAAEGGTLFLDEIGELDIGLQAKLLRVLQENRVLAVGTEYETLVNVRFITATNQDLECLVAQRRFRGDLFHRLRVLSINVPPLRERPADIVPLVRHFLQSRHSLQTVESWTDDFLEAIRQLDLPGNVRQLENLIYDAIARHQRTGPLDFSDLPADVMRLLTRSNQTVVPSSKPQTTEQCQSLPGFTQAETNELVKRILDDQGWNLSKVMNECERHVFQAAMRRTGGNQSQTARLLGLTPRSVYNKIHKFRLHF